MTLDELTQALADADPTELAQALTDAVLPVLAEAMVVEVHRRRTLTQAEALASEVRARADDDAQAIATAYIVARDSQVSTDVPAPWVRPTGPHDVYPPNWLTTHLGKVWRSTTPNNAGEPGISGWREQPPEGQVADWLQPSGAHDAYKKGEVVAHAGDVWVSDYDGNDHEPGIAGWTRQAPEVPPDGPQPWATAVAYKVDDLVTHDGRIWRAKIDHTSHAGWAPSAATHAVWEDMGQA